MKQNKKTEIFYGFLFPTIILGGVILLIFKISYTFYKEDRFDFSQLIGSGTKEDPFIITAKSDIPQDFRLENSHNYCIFHRCNLNSLILTKSSNIAIKSCKINLLIARQCEKLSISDSSIEKELSLIECQLNKILGCRINKLSLYFNSNNLFEVNRILLIDNEFSFNNTFNKNNINQQEVLKLSKDKVKEKRVFKPLSKNNLMSLIYITICFSCALLLSSYYFNNILVITIFTILIFFVLVLLLSILHAPNLIIELRLRKKAKLMLTFPDNTINE